MIKHDKSYLSDFDLLAIEKGYAVLDVRQLRIERKDFTEEQKAQNEKVYNSVSKEEWSRTCEVNRKEIAKKVKRLTDSLNSSFSIYQYDEEDKEKVSYKSDWDLFFWCNGDSKGRDYSYITLNFNDKRTPEQRKNDLEKVLNYCKEIGFNDLNIIIQYTTKYNNELVKNVALEYAEKMKNVFIDYRGYKGKIKEVGKNHQGNSVYGFFKKGSKKNYYTLSSLDLLSLVIQ